MLDVDYVIFATFLLIATTPLISPLSSDDAGGAITHVTLFAAGYASRHFPRRLLRFSFITTLMPLCLSPATMITIIFIAFSLLLAIIFADADCHAIRYFRSDTTSAPSIARHHAQQ